MLQDSYRPETVTMNREPGASHLKRNYDVCRALDMLKLGIVLDDMVKAGMPKEQAACFKEAAHALLQLLRTENNRLLTAAPKPIDTQPGETL